MYGTEYSFNIRCSIRYSIFFTSYTINTNSTSSTSSSNNSGYHNNNNSAVQVGEESIEISPHRSPNVPADPWTQFHYNPQKPPYGEYITVVEQACLNLEPHNAEELRAEIRETFRHAHNPRKNITKEEAQGLAELRKDHSRVILTADKGVDLAVMDRADYNNKAQKLFEDRGTCRKIKTDPTNKLKNKLASLLKKIKAKGGISDQLYKKMYPAGSTQNSQKRHPPSDPVCLAEVPLIMNWLRSYQES